VPLDHHLATLAAALRARLSASTERHVQEILAGMTKVAQEEAARAAGAVAQEAENARAAAVTQLKEERAKVSSLEAQLRYLQDRLRDLEAGWRASQASSARATPTTAGDQRLCQALAALERAPSLGSTLDAVGRALGRLAPRHVLLVLEDEAAIAWSLSGFQAGPDVGADRRVPLHREGPLAAVLANRQTVEVADPARLFSLQGAAPARAGLLAALDVGGEPVALAYVDTARDAGTEEGAARMRDDLALLLRHASWLLEAVTTERTLQTAVRMSEEELETTEKYR
jgi:hypothetical protein